VKFDWYQATIPGRPLDILASIGRLGDEVVPNDRVAKMYRYTQGFEVKRGGNTIACVAMGQASAKHASPIEHVHAWATSDDAPAFADLVRNEYGHNHSVTRVDVCQDFIDATAFTRLRRVGRRIAKDHRMKFAMVQDGIDKSAGRTQYIGSPSSEYRARIYEKGWEVVGKAIAALKGYKPSADAITSMEVPGMDRTCHPSEWTRAELQARPKHPTARQTAAFATPEQLWGFSEWSQNFAREAFSLELERIYVRMRKVTNDERALRFMVSQYGNVLRRLHGDLGDWACVGKQIGEVWADVQAERNKP
jgi:hypothetical protein